MSAAPIGPGDFVECIVECNEGSPGILAHWLCGAQIEKGRVYTVMLVRADIDNFGNMAAGFVLVERDTHWPATVLGGDLGAWNADHFRPIYRRDESIIQTLKAPPINAPARESEEA